MPNRVDDRPDELRRKLLKSSALLGGAFAAAHAMPYVKPGSKSFEGIPSAYAMLSPGGPYLIPSCTAEDLSTLPGEVADDGIVTNITATVVPIPPTPLLIDCTPTSTDPANPSGTTASALTDAAGVATFPDFNMSTDWPSPLVQVGEDVTFTHSFNDPACGPDTCATTLTVVPGGTPLIGALDCVARGLDPPHALHQNGVLLLQATVWQDAGKTIPVAGATVTATIETDHPANPTATVSPLTAISDAAGVADFAVVRMGTDFPNPPLPFGTMVTVNFSAPSSGIVNPVTCGPVALPVVP